MNDSSCVIVRGDKLFVCPPDYERMADEAGAFLRRNGDTSESSDNGHSGIPPEKPRPHIENFYITTTKIGFGVGPAQDKARTEACRGRPYHEKHTDDCYEVRCSVNHSVAHDWYVRTFSNRVCLDSTHKD